MLQSPYVKICVTKYPMHVTVTSKFPPHEVLLSHFLPCGTNARDLDTFVCCLSRIYPEASVNAIPLSF